MRYNYHRNIIIFKYGNDPQVMQTFEGLTTSVTIGDTLYISKMVFFIKYYNFYPYEM